MLCKHGYDDIKPNLHKNFKNSAVISVVMGDCGNGQDWSEGTAGLVQNDCEIEQDWSRVTVGLNKIGQG